MNAARFLITASAALLLAACGGNGEAPTEVSTPVRVTEVETAPLGGGLRAIGLVAPADEIRLSFKTGGVIRTIHVDQGERVRAGQLLATLADDEVAAAVAQASAVADKAARDLQRGRALLADEVATREQVEDLATAGSVADAALRGARFNARHARIEAPVDGVVLRRLAEPSESVGPGQPVLLVGGTGGGWVVRATLSDRDIVRVALGDAAELTLDAYPGKRFSARITELAAAADPATGTYEIRLAFDAAGERLVQGLVAKVSLLPTDASQVTVVPLTALLEADGSAARVYVVAAGESVAREVAVETGSLIGERIEITAGLQPGQSVVTEGAAWLRDGAAVRVLDGR